MMVNLALFSLLIAIINLSLFCPLFVNSGVAVQLLCTFCMSVLSNTLHLDHQFIRKELCEQTMCVPDKRET